MNNTTKINKEEGLILAAAREEMDLTQAELATKLGWGTPQFVSNVERGAARIPANKLKRLAVIIGEPPVRAIINIRVKSYRSELLSSIKAKSK